MPKSIESGSGRKEGAKRPAKPYPDFPLFPHSTGRWAKKIRGKMCYFGRWDKVEDGDWKAAVELYQHQRDDLYAGRKPRPVADGTLTIDLLCRAFLKSKSDRVDSGELAPRTFQDYKTVCQRVEDAFGRNRPVDDLQPGDFEDFRAKLSKTRGPTSLTNDIQRVRILFKYALDSQLIERPVNYGQSFAKPNRAVMRRVRAERGPRCFEAAELRKMIKAAPQPLKAMLLLAINAGLGNSDCGHLPISALDLKRGWLDFPRPKTGIERRCPLWTETVKAIRDWLAVRPDPKDPAHARLLFITAKGLSWAKTGEDNPISKETRKLLMGLKLHKHGLSFYALRHTFQTTADEALDQVATSFIMGHAAGQNDMASTYREKIGDERLLAVTNHVHGWLFPKPAEKRNAPERPRPLTA